jgi:anti-anti-sigma factor
VEDIMGLEHARDADGVPNFEIAAERDGGTHYLRLDGEFDIACTETFREQVAAVLRERPEAVIVDLSRLQFIDSSGLRLVMEARGLCEDSGLDYSVIAGSGQVRRVFDLTGMDEVLPVSDAEHRAG